MNLASSLQLDLSLHYQPVVDLVSGEVVGAEGLVRAPHRMRRTPTATLLRQLREVDFPLFPFVLDRVVADHELWRRFATDLRCSVNASVADLLGTDLELVIARALANRDPLRLMIEINDVQAGDDLSRLGDAVEVIRAAGLEVALTGFTAGQQSIALFERLQPEVIKLDRSVVAAIELFDASVDLGVVTRFLKSVPETTDVVALGVERIGHVRSLRDIGCTHAQGFLFSRALPAGELVPMLAGPDAYA